MHKVILNNDDARSGVKLGVDIVADAVKQTLGYGGRTVIISEKELPTRMTKDGVTVASSISIKDSRLNAGAKLVKEVSSKTAQDVGDGTTTVCVLMQKLVSEGLKVISNNAHPMKVKNGMELALDVIVEHVKKMATPVSGPEILKQVAAVSANNDEEIGGIISSLYDKLGPNGVVSIENSMDVATRVEIVDGFEFICGYISPYFSNTSNNKCVLEDCYVLVVDGKVTHQKHLAIFNQIVKESGKSVLIVADDFDQVPGGLMIENKMRGTLNSCAVKYNFMDPTRTELFLDICAVTGATPISEKKGQLLEKVTMDKLGYCERAIISDKETRIIKGKKNEEELKKRISDAQTKIDEATHPSLRQRSEYRKAALEGGVGVCYVGALTEVEREEKKDRVDDSIRATKAAMEEGIVPGGGTALLRCIPELERLKKSIDDEDVRSGVNIVIAAAKAPAQQIIFNTGNSFGKEHLESTGSYGFNAKTGHVEDLLAAGIIDPAKVVRVCIENSVSAAAQILITSALIIPDETISK